MRKKRAQFEGTMENPHLRKYQERRMRQIEDWYQQIGNPNLNIHLDSSIRYLLVWVAFNALYNVADMPNRKPKKPDRRTGQPKFRGFYEGPKLEQIAEKLNSDGRFIQKLYQDNRRFVEDISSRRPLVSQPDSLNEIQYEVKGKPHIFRPKDARGIASLDNRIVLKSGHKIFEYTSLKITLKKDGTLKNRKAFTRQLIFVLYQIRNNVAHGGSVAFFSRGKKVSEGAIKVLDEIVKHLLDNPNILISIKK